MRHRRGRWAAVAAIGLAACTAVSAQVFHGIADLVVLNVTVTDAESRLVGRLDQKDFQVLEDGMPQEIALFRSGQQPIALSILLDTSTSMEKKLPMAQEAAVGFVQRLGASDVAQVMSFDTRADALQDFTGNKAALENAIRRTHAGGSTALYIAVYTALRNLERIGVQDPADIRRQAIIVLSDGEDTSSVIDYDQVIDAAKHSNVTIYTIALRDRHETPAHGFNEADFVLRSFAQETGGRLYHVEEPTQLPAIYQQIADELANQYTIGYSSRNAKRDGSWRRIMVKINRPAVSARTKSGYYAPSRTQ